MKKVNATMKHKYPTVKEQIAPFLALLDGFTTEDGFDEFCEEDHITITMGKGRTAKTYFCPTTWEYAERFIRSTICHLIDSDDKQNTEYYKPIYDDCKAWLEKNPLNTDYFVL